VERFDNTFLKCAGYPLSLDDQAASVEISILHPPGMELLANQREYLTEGEIESLLATVGKSRNPVRDRLLILMAFRHAKRLAICPPPHTPPFARRDSLDSDKRCQAALHLFARWITRGAPEPQEDGPADPD
jgi:hypothetical protein